MNETKWGLLRDEIFTNNESICESYWNLNVTFEHKLVKNEEKSQKFNEEEVFTPWEDSYRSVE